MDLARKGARQPSRPEALSSEYGLYQSGQDGSIGFQVDRAGVAPAARKVDIRLPGKDNLKSHGARPVHEIIVPASIGSEPCRTRQRAASVPEAGGGARR